MNFRHDRTMRLFAAVPVAAPVRLQLNAGLEHLRAGGWFHRWVHPDDYHITLKFLGETPPHQAAAVQNALRQAAAGCPPFTLTAGPAGCFGPPDTPTVFWAGVGGDLEALRRLQREVESRLAALGFAPESRPYTPHITLARKAKPASRKRLRGVALPPVETLTWRTDEIVLYRTHMGRSPMYEPIARVPLSPSPAAQ
jgi:2'-5' RNA ligase